MKFTQILKDTIWLLLTEGRVSYRRLKIEFDLDDESLEEIRLELIQVKRLAADHKGQFLLWSPGAETVNAPDLLQPSEELPRLRLVEGEHARSTEVLEHTSPHPAKTPAPRTVEAIVPGGERRHLTVMFCDLVGSTELSTQLDPEDLQDVIRGYQDAVTKIIREFDGFVAKYMGDGVLAYFGYPQAHENDAERSVRAGLDIVWSMVGLNAEIGERYEIELAVRVGIATGLVVVGDIIGEGASEEANVVGETPNVAARLQGLAEPNQVVIGPITRELIGGAFVSEDLGTHSLKGIAEPVRAWNVLGESDIDSGDEVGRVEGGLPLVGRDEELGLLLRSWEASKEARGQAVLIQGEAGIGKSRLVEALREQASGENHTWVAFRCSPYHTNSALYPVIEHLKRVMGWAPEDSAAASLEKLEVALKRQSLPPEEAVPLYAELMSLPLPEGRYAPLGLSATQQRERTFDALAGWLLEEAEQTPMLNVWEDLHWADPTTLELLELYIEQSPTVSMLNVLTYRPEFVPPWTMRSHMTPITLNRLEKPEAEALIGYQAAGKQVPSEVIEHIVGKADGVPLYIEELTKTILESDYLREQTDRFTLVGSLSEVSIPATLQDTLMARLDSLPAVRELAQLGAVLGREFAYEMLQPLAEVEEANLLEGLGQLVDAELLYQRGRGSRAKYIFKHALIQDAAYESLLKRTRQNYHQQVATLMEEQFPEAVDTHPELVAHHCTQAGQAEKAIDYLSRAGQQAIKRSADVEALAHLGKALELLNAQPESSDRDAQELELQIALMGPIISVKGYAGPELEQTITRALKLCDRIGDVPNIFPVLYGRWVNRYTSGRSDECHDLAKEFVSRAEGQPGAIPKIVGYRVLGSSSLITGRPADAEQNLTHAWALCGENADEPDELLYGQDVRVSVLAACSWAQWHVGKPDEAFRYARDALDRARELGHANTLMYANFHFAWLCSLASRFEDMVEVAGEIVEFAEQKEMPVWSILGRIFLFWPLVEAMPDKGRIDRFEINLSDYRRLGWRWLVPRLLPVLGLAYGKTGDLERGEELFNEAVAMMEDGGERMDEPEIYRLWGELEILRDAPHDAERQLLQALEVARAQSARAWELRAATSLARLWHGQGKTSEAHDLLAPVYGWFTEGSDMPDLKQAKALLDELS